MADVQLRIVLVPPARRYTPVRACRRCGCTDHHPCVHVPLGLICEWETDRLCTACAEDALPGWTHPDLRPEQAARRLEAA